jgi:hypothetical protein
MWVLDRDTNNWELKNKELSRDSFEIFQQDLIDLTFYSKCLSGATFIAIDDLDNIYSPLEYLSSRKTWYIGLDSSQYAVLDSIPQEEPMSIDRQEANTYYDRYLSDYGFTLKNKFTPDRLIKDSLSNYITIDLATTAPLDSFSGVSIIDGVRLKNGHRVLVKDQKSRFVLPVGEDPSSVVDVPVNIVENFGSTIEYEFSNSQNGVYVFDNGNLIKEDLLSDYKKSFKFSASIKEGIVNRDTRYYLDRKNNGFYPIDGENISFSDGKSYLLRNRVDYRNLFDLDFYDILQEGAAELNVGGNLFYIQPRIITVGEFGTIVIHQGGKSNFLDNNFKQTLRSITSTRLYYWIVGDLGTILRVSKHNLEIVKIEADCECPISGVRRNLKSISFLNDGNGVIVGDLNSILITNDSGKNWENIHIPAFDSFYFRKVFYRSIDSFFISGNNGVFIEFKKDLSGLTAYKRRISLFLTKTDEYINVYNINDFIYVELLNGEFNPTWKFFPDKTTSTDKKELLILVCDDSKIIIHDLNKSLPHHTQFFYLDMGDNDYGDITNIIRKGNTGTDFYFTSTRGGIHSLDLSKYNEIGAGDDDISNLIVINDDNGEEEDAITNILDIQNNKMFDFNSNSMLICGANSMIKSWDYVIPEEEDIFIDIDSTFLERVKPRMLFLDYDIASKLTFFDKFGEYRLPVPVVFNNINNINNIFSFGIAPGDIDAILE